MVHVKKMVMTGFKSFARRTEIVFDQGVNVILGPNGSGKSNVADAICFVLGRLSIKSMRAAKAKNLLFMGSKYIKPGREASVEIVFDNTDKTFPLDKEEISLMRIVRHNGVSIYKINDEVKTRTEVVEMLTLAGINPYGFNIILQGQIQYIVRMQSEERRKIIEEVAGISIYESKKEKSLKELEKTEERLKEIAAILRERSIYMKNLEKERAQALRFQELQGMQKRLKASILSRKIEDKVKELEKINKSIAERLEQREKEKAEADTNQKQIESLQEQINQINKSIQQATGIEQETLNDNLSNLKAELEGLKVRRENYENKKIEIERRIEGMQKSIPSLEQEIAEARKQSPIMAMKAAELKKKKEELLKIEEERNKLYNFKTELFSSREIAKDKERQLTRAQTDSENILKQIEDISLRLKMQSEEECTKSIGSMKQSLIEKEKTISDFYQTELSNEKLISIAEVEIARAEKIKSQVDKIDTCPLCQSKITPEHINHVFLDSNNKISEFNKQLDNSRIELSKIKDQKAILNNEIRELKGKIADLELDLMKHKALKD
ncbi:MAG: AAA family ATPase, partial [archaeon]